MSNSREQLVELVQSMTLYMKDYITLGVFFFFFFFYFFKKLIGKIEFLIEKNIDELNKKICRELNEIKTQMVSMLTVIEEKISECTSQISSLEKTKIYKLNASNTVDGNNASCQASVDIAAFVRNTTTKINDMNMTTLNISARLREMNETIQNLTNLVVPVFNVSDIITTTEVNEPVPSSFTVPSECDHSRQEEGGTVAVVGDGHYTEYTEISARRRHTVVNMTSAGLQEYTMYFAVRGERVALSLSSTSPRSDLYYEIGFHIRGNIYMEECLPIVSYRTVHDIFTSNIISMQKYIYYYVTISGDTLEVGRRGEPPLMTHTSTELSRLRYLSFMRGWNYGQALYDCPAE